MAHLTQLPLDPSRPVQALNGGLFVSLGHGTHPDRVIDSHELIFVRSGTLSMLVEQDQRFDVPAGQTLLLLPHRRHRGAAPYGPDLSFYWIHFRPGHPRRASTKATPSSLLRVPQQATPDRPDRLAELLHRFIDDQESGQLEPAAANLLMTLMLCEVARHRAAAHAHSSGAALAGRTAAYVKTHLHDPRLSTSRIAEALDYNSDYLTRVFHAVTGQTLTEHIHRQRTREARALLRETSASIKHIATRCGFADPGYFRRTFRRYEGITPSAFRRLYARLHVNVH